jgi:hypothetical protein
VIVDVDAVANELYGLPPSDFTAARNERAADARRSGDREAAESIKALRRPTLAAWASNLLVREHPEQVDPLLRLGEALRRAHQDLDGSQLRELSKQQRVLITAMSRLAGQLAMDAGNKVSEGALREVEETIRAALADPDAAREWASGRLSAPLRAPSGFAAVSGSAVRAPARQAKPKAEVSSIDEARQRRAEQRRQEALDKARRAAEAAAGDLAAAQQRHEDGQRTLHEAEEHAEDARLRVVTLGEELRRAEEHRRDSLSSVRKARDRLRDTQRAVQLARRKADDAAGHLDHLSTEDSP